MCIRDSGCKVLMTEDKKFHGLHTGYMWQLGLFLHVLYFILIQVEDSQQAHQPAPRQGGLPCHCLLCPSQFFAFPTRGCEVARRYTAASGTQETTSTAALWGKSSICGGYQSERHLPAVLQFSWRQCGLAGENGVVFVVYFLVNLLFIWVHEGVGVVS